ncbi:MAG TPA: class I SAM-dependent methyltransferase, partial [Dongiaceae bacterium]|nr:class I SAM-dependent methyltransferase [Dongiaceae bacterium]
LFAALFPQGDFQGVDLDPVHIASAERLRQAAVIDNARFSATSFAAMATASDAPAQDCDFIVLHGVMSWVSAAVRRDIAALIRRRLKPGGIVYASYNCQPGWAVKMPLRELLLAAFERAAGATVAARIAAAIALLRDLADSGAHYLDSNPAVLSLLEMIEGQEAGYLAHEFLNRHWTIFYHRDMAAEMQALGLAYLGSADAADNVPLLAVPQKPAALMAAQPDPVLRETLRDMALNRQFRRDLYGFGLKPLPLSDYVAAWRETRFALAVPRAQCALTIKRSFGDVTLDAAIFDPLLDRLAQGTAGFEDLRAVAAIRGWGLGDQLQAIQLLVATDFARPIVGGAAVAADHPAVQRFNDAVFSLAQAEGIDTVALAVPDWSGAQLVPIMKIEQP